MLIVKSLSEESRPLSRHVLVQLSSLPRPLRVEKQLLLFEVFSFPQSNGHCHSGALDFILGWGRHYEPRLTTKFLGSGTEIVHSHPSAETIALAAIETPRFSKILSTCLAVFDRSDALLSFFPERQPPQGASICC